MIEYFQDIHDIAEAGSVYLYNFIMDYNDYMKECRAYIPIGNFLRIWTCIPPQAFSYLKQGDTFFYGPTEVICMDNAFESSEGMLMVEVEEYASPSNNPSIFITEGDAYCKHKPWIIPPERYPAVLRNDNRRLNGKEALCQKAVLITKTNQQSS